MTDSPNHNISKQNDVEPAEAYSTKRRHERDWALRAPRSPRWLSLLLSTVVSNTRDLATRP